MKKIITFSAVILLFVSFTNAQTRIPVQSGENVFEVTNTNTGGFSVFNTVAYLDVQLAPLSKGQYVALSAEGYGPSYNFGNPDLPVLNRLFEIPVNATVNVNIISYTEKTLKLSDFDINMQISPSQEPVAKSADLTKVVFKKNEKTYAANQWFSNTVAQFHEEGTMRGTRIGRIEINPFAYNPVTGELKIYNDLKVEVTFTNGDDVKTQALKQQYSSPAFDGMFTGLLNYNSDKRGDVSVHSIPVHFVIISHRMFEETLQPFIAWKKKQGYLMTVRYTDETEVGNTTTSIKNYLQGLYVNPTETSPAPTYVLFVGDMEQVATFVVTTSDTHPTDLYYTTYDGASDIIADVLPGRMSAKTVEQLEAIIEKTLMYEQYTMPDPSYLANSLTIAGVDGSYASTYGNGAVNYMLHYLNTAHGVNNNCFLYPASGASGVSGQIVNIVNNGIAWGNYTAHGSESGWADPNFSTGSISQLNNDGKYGILIGNCCLAARFNVDACFAEAITRAANKGAVAYIGASDYTYWNEDYWWATGYGTVSQNPAIANFGIGSYDALFHENGEAQNTWASTVAQVNEAGRFAVNESNTSMKKYYWEIYHVFGDPTLTPYVGTVQTTNPSYMEVLPLGLNTLEISSLAPYAYVALTDQGTLKAAGFADASGNITLNFETFDAPTTADIVATAARYKPYIGTIGIIPGDNAYVISQNVTVNDANSNNNNGQIDYNETISFNIELKNVGTVNATNVSAKLRTTNEYVNINDSSIVFGNINSESTASHEDIFSITLDKEVPDQTTLDFTLAITDGTDEWNSKFNFKANSPVLEILTFGIAEIEGNGNGRIDPEETVRITIPVKNTGHAKGLPVTVSLSSSLSAVEVQTLTQEHQGLQAGETGNFQFTVVSAADIEPATVLGLTATVESDIFSVTAERSYTMGLLVEDFESGVQSGFNWAYNNNQWGINTEEYYEGNASVKSGATANSSKSVLSITMDVSTEGEISFYRKVSSESNYDKLFFKINGEVKNGTGWSGDLDWEQFTYNVSAGINTFEWSYEKDNSSTGGSDCAWIDYVIFPAPAENPAPATNLYAEKQGSDVVLIWDNPSSEKLLNLTLYRLSEGQATGEWTAIATTEEFFAIDEDWGDLPDGAYQYAVVANYSFMNSAPVFSELLGMNMEVPYTIHINVEDGKATAAGASILLTNIDPTHAFVYDELSGDTGATFDNIWKGVYTLTVTKEGFETYTEDNIEITEEGSHDITLISKVGIYETSADGFTLYPNPATDNLTIMTESGNTATLEIYNVNGIIERTIMMTGNKQEVDVSMLNSGIYVLRITDNEKVIIKQFVKK